MPCYECENGKWRFGETGECQYDSKLECETDNKDYYAEETYNDYPQEATNNAKRALKYKEENGSDCGTPVGWTRARQLANRESLSRDTIARIASFKRHQQHKDVPYDEGCGGIMWDAWGGDAGVNWAIKRLEQIDKKNMAKKRKYYSDEEHDHHFHFTQEMMEKLHHDGELEVKVEEDDKEMVILFTYGEEETKEYSPEEEEEIKDEFVGYFYAESKLNSKGYDNASSLIENDKIDRTSDWSFSTEDSNALLGEDGDDWDNYSKWFLLVNEDANEETKDRYKFPFGKEGKIYRSALTAIRQRAGQFGYDDVFDAAGKLIEKIDEEEVKDEFEAYFDKVIKNLKDSK